MHALMIRSRSSQISSNLEQLEAVITIAGQLGRYPMSGTRYRQLLGVT